MSGIIMPLDEIETNKICVVCSLIATGNERRRLLDLGIVRGTQILVLGKSPSGDPTAYFIRGIVIALRSECAKNIMVRV